MSARILGYPPGGIEWNQVPAFFTDVEALPAAAKKRVAAAVDLMLDDHRPLLMHSTLLGRIMVQRSQGHFDCLRSLPVDDAHIILSIRNNPAGAPTGMFLGVFTEATTGLRPVYWKRFRHPRFTDAMILGHRHEGLTLWRSRRYHLTGKVRLSAYDVLRGQYICRREIYSTNG